MLLITTAKPENPTSLCSRLIVFLKFGIDVAHLIKLVQKDKKERHAHVCQAQLTVTEHISKLLSGLNGIHITKA